MARFLPVLLALIAASGLGRAEIVTKPVAYKHGTTNLEGLLVSDSAAKGKRPGVLLAHEQGAASAQARAKSTHLAQLGYVVFSLDLYGKGVTPKDAADAASRT